MGLHVASAKETGERIVAGRKSGLPELGESVAFEARHFGLTIRMTSKIIEFERPNRFVDEMQKGPFARLRHEHAFASTARGVRMLDRMDFASPFGPFGAVADRLFVMPHLRRFLIERGRVLREHLEERARQS